MKVKVSEATNLQLDWLVNDIELRGRVAAGEYVKEWVLEAHQKAQSRVFYTADWLCGGPIIEREKLTLAPLFFMEDGWRANHHNLRYDDKGEYIQGSDNEQTGPTPLIAAMRCYVASKLGEEVEVPDELQS